MFWIFEIGLGILFLYLLIFTIGGFFHLVDKFFTWLTVQIILMIRSLLCFVITSPYRLARLVWQGLKWLWNYFKTWQEQRVKT